MFQVSLMFSDKFETKNGKFVRLLVFEKMIEIILPTEVQITLVIKPLQFLSPSLSEKVLSAFVGNIF